MRSYPALLLALIAVCGGAATTVAYADDITIAREIDAALLRLADHESLDGSSIRRPARTLYELGAVVDVREPNAQGLPVLAVTPRSAAERIGLRQGDRLLQVNGVAISTATKPATALRQAVASEGGRLRLDVRRNNQSTVLTGTADRVHLPAYTLSLGSASGIAATNAGCGRVSTFDALPRSSRKFPVVVIAIDGRTPPSDGEITRLPAGKHRLLLAERIDSDRFSAVQLKQRDALGRKAYKSLDLEVAPDTTYQLAASLEQTAGSRIAEASYWSPLVHRTTKEACR